MKKNLLTVTLSILMIVLAMRFAPQEKPTSNFAVLASQGIHGPSHGVTEHPGDMQVTAPNVTLQNMHITGNLYLKPQGPAQIKLTNMRVSGAIVITAHESASLQLDRATASFLTIGRAPGTVEVTPLDHTHFPHVRIFGSAILHETESPAFAELLLEEGSSTHLHGTFALLTVAGSDISLHLQTGEILALFVGKDLPGATILLDEETILQRLECKSPVTVYGNGIIRHADLQVPGSRLDREPELVTPTAGETLYELPEPEPVPQQLVIYRIVSVSLASGEERLVDVTTLPAENTVLTVTSSRPEIVAAAISRRKIRLLARALGSVQISVTASHPDFQPAAARFTVTVSLPQTAAPTSGVPSGAVIVGTSIALTSRTPGAVIYYTTDGSQPTTASLVYSVQNMPTVPEGGLTIRAIAVADGMSASPEATFTYTIAEPLPPQEDPLPPTPEPDPSTPENHSQEDYHE